MKRKKIATGGKKYDTLNGKLEEKVG